MGLEWSQKWNERYEGRLSYLPGFGTEAGGHAVFIQDFEAEGWLHFSERCGLRLNAHGSETPTYRQMATELSLTLRASMGRECVGAEPWWQVLE